jgi:hypothetical protein
LLACCMPPPCSVFFLVLRFFVPLLSSVERNPAGNGDHVSVVVCHEPTHISHFCSRISLAQGPRADQVHCAINGHVHARICAVLGKSPRCTLITSCVATCCPCFLSDGVLSWFGQDGACVFWLCPCPPEQLSIACSCVVVADVSMRGRHFASVVSD